MHWSERLADKIIEKNPNKETYVCAGGASPSGSIHIGNFRDMAVPYFVAKALKKKGKNVRFIFSLDDFDRLRKVPVNVSNVVDGFEQHIGKAYANVPNPFGTEESSYAEYFENEFMTAVKNLGIDVEFIKQNVKYKNGDYAEKVAYALSKREQIYDILMSFKSQAATEEGKKSYYPIEVYCSECLKDSTVIDSYNDETHELTYHCKACGKQETVNVLSYFNIKLGWKVDWPMRWGVEGVDFEAGGIDHATPGGSYDVSSVIAREIFGIEPPTFQGYGWLGFQGVSSMHSSSGVNITPAGAMKFYTPEVIRWLFAKYDPEDAYNFYFDDTIIRHYSEFDKGLAAYLAGEADEFTTSLFDLCLLDGVKYQNETSFNTISSLAPIVNFNHESLVKAVSAIDLEWTPRADERFEKATYFINTYQPEKIFKLLDAKNVEFADTLQDEEKAVVKKLYDYLYNAETVKDKEVQQFIYNCVNNPNLTKKENIAVQQKYFKIFYNLLFGKDSGPRLYLFFAASNKASYIELLNI
ncbi:MAG: lysine--tRNA ligase [Clostridia bacterium]|nr:lysine--tRNA ligase [Clostridia bacterium]